jgi:hypothetical protein
MVPGPLAILRAIGLPLISSLGISLAVYLNARTRRLGNAAVFFACSIVAWLVVGLSQ